VTRQLRDFIQYAAVRDYHEKRFVLQDSSAFGVLREMYDCRPLLFLHD